MPWPGVSFLSRALQKCNVPAPGLGLGWRPEPQLAWRMRFIRIPFWCFATVFLAACGRRETPVAEGIRTGTLLMGNQTEPADLDPHVVALFVEQRIQLALFE